MYIEQLWNNFRKKKPYSKQRGLVAKLSALKLYCKLDLVSLISRNALNKSIILFIEEQKKIYIH